jgi:hypothetical protein
MTVERAGERSLFLDHRGIGGEQHASGGVVDGLRHDIDPHVVRIRHAAVSFDQLSALFVEAERIPAELVRFERRLAVCLRK